VGASRINAARERNATAPTPAERKLWRRAGDGVLVAALVALGGCAYEPVSPPPSQYGFYNGYYFGAAYYTMQPLLFGDGVGRSWGGSWGLWRDGFWRR